MNVFAGNPVHRCLQVNHLTSHVKRSNTTDLFCKFLLSSYSFKSLNLRLFRWAAAQKPKRASQNHSLMKDFSGATVLRVFFFLFKERSSHNVVLAASIHHGQKNPKNIQMNWNECPCIGSALQLWAYCWAHLAANNKTQWYCAVFYCWRPPS